MSEELTLDQITNREVSTSEENKNQYVQSEVVQQPAIPSQYDGIINGESKAELVQADLDPEDFKDINEEENKSEDDDSISMDSINKEDEEIKPDEIVVLTQTKEIKDDGYSELNDEEKEKAEEQANFEEFKKEIRQIDIFDKVKLKDFKVSKAINYNNTISTSEMTTVADWVLYDNDAVISMKEFKGYELSKLLNNDTSRSLSNRYRDMFTSIYEHVNSGKPATMEEWLKQLKWSSLDDLYFSIYKASFSGANHIPFQCPKCKKQYVARDIPMERMYKFKNDKIRKKVEDMLVTGNQKLSNPVTLIQISDNYAAAIKIPSIYDIVMEPTALTEEFREKYKDIIEIISYIENIFFIDNDSKELRPIDLKVYHDSKEKTLKERIFKYGKIINQLTPDQFSRFHSYLQMMTTNIDGENKDIRYILPGTECPHCHAKSEDQPMDAQGLLFIRHQLTGLANLSTL